MKILTKACGEYQTNCYIVQIGNKELIIDPGVGAFDWVVKHVKNPVAILNTHGHFDHIWSNQALKEHFNIPIVIEQRDAFLLNKEQFGRAIPKSTPDILVNGDEILRFGDIEVRFLHFAGHSPGCSVIEIADVWFSGDFIFKGSIGRVDFPSSSPSDMKHSLKRFQKIAYDKRVYPGHGGQTSIKAEQKFTNYWLNAI